MCSGAGCPAKEKCYRAMATPDDLWQSYFVNPPIKDGKCEHYWGDNQESIWQQLLDIVKEKDNK